MTLTRYRRGAGRLPFRWQTVFSREVGGRSAGCELLHRTFFCPGIDRCSALEFYTLQATDRAQTERELVERGGGARKQGNVLEGKGGWGRVKQNSFQLGQSRIGQKVSH